MNKKTLKAVSLIALLTVTAGLMQGCSTEKNVKVPDEPVTLKYVMMGPGRQKDSQEVGEKFNEKLHEYLPNVTVDINVIDMADYKQQVLLMQTSKEQLDIVNTYGLDFSTEVSNGSFLDMTDLLDEYGKETKEALPDWLFDYMTIDGKIYGVPSYQMLTNLRCLITQKEYAEKYLDVDGLKNELYNNTFFTEKTAQIINDYLGKLANDGKIGMGANMYNELPLAGYESVTDNFIMNTETHEIVYKFETDVMKEQYKRHSDWYKKGWIRKDALSYTDEGNAKGYKDGYVLWDFSYSPWTAASASKDGTEFIAIPFKDYYPIPKDNAAGGTAISASCEHPAEAMQFINLLQTNKELYNMLVYGIEGIHYTKTGDNTVETPYGETPTANDNYGLYKWIVGNTELAYTTQDQPNPEEYHKWVFDEVNKSEHRSELIGFVPDMEMIENNIAQLSAVKGEYMRSLASGALGDEWESYYNEWMEKTNAAGVDDVKAELQKQVDEFLKNNKN